ncbi:MAG: hypothetical protein RLZZ596_2589 [Pseudomonadota bacterium]|jgi:two-component system phosphate regulon sensor histidine kinase PhoR
MLWRAFSFLLIQGLGGWLGWLLAPDNLQIRGMVIGMLIASVLAFLVDFSRGLQVLRWLRREDLADLPVSHGLWGEVAYRVRRLTRRREQLAQASEKRLQDFLAALQASPNGVVLIDAEGCIEWFNQTAASHFGLDPQRDRLQRLVNLVRDPAFVAYASRKDFSHGLSMNGRGAGTSKPLRLSVQFHPYGEGRRLLLSRDITALEQAEAQRRDFVANVSHEIRTPLTVLAGFIETLQTLPLQEEERAHYLELMARQSQRMQSLVGDLLTLSRLEASPLPDAVALVPVPPLMAQLAEEAAALSAALAQGAQPVHELHFAASPPLAIRGSADEIHSALSNLVSNAVRYTPAGGSVRAEWLLHEDGGASFRVQDSGPGIAPEHIPRLTERFYRVDRSRSRDSGGTGLGLAIVKHVAQRHGAELHIESTPGRGSSFTIGFPAHRLHHVAESTPQPSYQ